MSKRKWENFNETLMSKTVMSKRKLEVCVDTFRSAQAALEAGADRIELCCALSVEGLTPSIGQLKQLKMHYPSTSTKTKTTAPVFCMLRPREGDFVYDFTELETIAEDLRMLRAHGADGFVFGALRGNGSVDEEACASIVKAAQPCPVTFHRAFDQTKDWKQSLETVISLGFTRLLSSGQAKTAYEGRNILREMVEQSGNRISVIVGSGLNPDNLSELIETIGAREYHGSFSKMRLADEQCSNSVTYEEEGGFQSLVQRKETSTEMVRKVVKILDDLPIC